MNIKSMVCVGPPFEEQTFYGPFDSHDEAVDWAEKTLGNNAYTWIVSLHPPESVE